MNVWLFDAGLALLLGGALLFIYYVKLTKKPQRDLVAELRARDDLEASQEAPAVQAQGDPAVPPLPLDVSVLDDLKKTKPGGAENPG